MMVFAIVVTVRKLVSVYMMNSDESASISSSWQNTCISENTKRVNALLNDYLIEKEGVENQSKSGNKKSVIKTIKSRLPSLAKESKKIYSQYQKYNDLRKEQYKQYTELQRTIQIYKGVLNLITTKDKQSLSDLFGKNWEYFPLLTDCFTSDLFGR